VIFQQWQQVLDGTKTQTRRLVKGREWYSPVMDCVMTSQRNGRMKWWVGQTYAVQPPGKSAVGRIKLLAIRRERLQDISEADLYREVGNGEPAHWFAHLRLWQFRNLWNNTHTAPGTRWADNPLVWVLKFELVKEQETNHADE